MAQRSFYVRAIWDEDAKTFYSESDIIGLHIEAESVAEFEDLMHEIAPGLVVANHVSLPDLATTPLPDLIPTIFWQPPPSVAA